MGADFWGPHFPRRHWGPHFPGWVVDPGNPPTGAATFVLILEAGVQVTYTWQTDVFKPYSGRERRTSLRDDPLQSLSGSALLIGDDVRIERATLARYAAAGRPFLIGLPYESLTLRADPSGQTVYVYSTVNCDWTNLGQRVIVVSRDQQSFAEFSVVSSTSDSITLDNNPGDEGLAGGVIMPALAWYLDPQQNFARYRPAEPFERWNLTAQLAVTGFQSAGASAFLALADPLTTGGALETAELYARAVGIDGNNIVVTQSDDAVTSIGLLIEDVDAQTLHIKYMADTTTVAEYVTLLASSVLVGIRGTYVGTDILAATVDAFVATSLADGEDLTSSEMGTNATLATHAGKPVYDRRLETDDTIGDSIHSMHDIVSLGAIPFSVATVSAPDAGRQILFESSTAPEWQWLKLFLGTVKGSWKSFYLPTWRADMLYAARATVTSLTRLTVAEADIFAWFPYQRTHLQILQADGTVTYATITLALDNGDGTADIQLDVLLTSEDVAMISWLDLCRLEQDAVTVQFESASYKASLQARAIQVTV